MVPCGNLRPGKSSAGLYVPRAFAGTAGGGSAGFALVRLTPDFLPATGVATRRVWPGASIVTGGSGFSDDCARASSGAVRKAIWSANALTPPRAEVRYMADSPDAGAVANLTNQFIGGPQPHRLRKLCSVRN